MGASTRTGCQYSSLTRCRVLALHQSHCENANKVNVSRKRGLGDLRSIPSSTNIPHCAQHNIHHGSFGKFAGIPSCTGHTAQAVRTAANITVVSLTYRWTAFPAIFAYTAAEVRFNLVSQFFYIIRRLSDTNTMIFGLFSTTQIALRVSERCLVRRKIVPYTLWMRQAILTEPFIATMAPPICQAICAASD